MTQYSNIVAPALDEEALSQKHYNRHHMPHLFRLCLGISVPVVMQVVCQYKQTNQKPRHVGRSNSVHELAQIALDR